MPKKVRKLFPKDAHRMFENEHRLWLDRQGTYEDYIMGVVKAFQKHLKGIHYANFMDAVEEVIANHQNRVYRYTRDLILELKKDGYFLLAISHSPKSVLEKFCKEMGFDKVYGKIYEIGPENKFTGVVADEHLIGNKSNVVRRAVEKENLTLEGSVGVGDTEGDIPFLEMVEKPICFNPNAALYKIARINNWKVVVERKDVVYEMQ